ncbi:hypothetical protein GCM10009689_17040 [Brevibacterium antiquum]|uniref:LAGLIDADG family homing endonuclease n=1 Tax=Brevibacterium antiquum TaxID=234835 RepID=UPI0018DF06BA|nr:LAGLIDADG family homing endonuclease [Brevibacterium antiquum]
MAKKKMNALELAQSPLWPTAIKSRYRDGRIRTINDGVWLVRKIPLMPMTDAKSDDERYAAGVPIMNATQELAHITSTFGKNRALNKSGYRVVKFLSINTPVLYRAPKDHPIRSKLNEWFGDKVVREKICVMAVKLIDSLGAGRDIKGAMDSAWQSFVTGGIPLEDFDRDAAIVSNALHRAGLVAPDEGEMRILDAWWNHGSHSDTPFMPHSDHLHVFSDTDSMAIADRAGLDDCSKWPKMPGQFSVSFAAVSSIDIEPTDNFTAVSPEASWVSQLTQSGALVVSISGRIEPAKQTRSELRRNRKKYMEDIKERQEQGAMSQADEDEHHGMLQSMEGAYAGRGAPATIVDCSIVVGFSGKKDFSLMGNDSIVELNPMINRQPQAMAETWLGSSVRANPYAQELPMTTIAASGINDLSRVGDKSGASVGLTERDSRMAYLSPTAASNKDSLPICMVPGATGSGKLLTLSTPVPTPIGWTTIGKLEVGDDVLGRSGMPTRVSYLSPINETPDLYRMTLSDGQQLDADFDHQFVVSSHMDRNRFKSDGRRRALENFARALEDVSRLKAAAVAAPGDAEATLDELYAHVNSLNLNEHRWSSALSLYSALRMVEAPHRYAKRTGSRNYDVKSITKTDPSRLFDLKAGLEACVHRWETMDPRNAARWKDERAKNLGAARTVLESLNGSRPVNAGGLAMLLADEGAHIQRGDRSSLLNTIRNAGVSTYWGTASVTIGLPETTEMTRDVLIYPLADTLARLALRLEQQYANQPSADYAERRMTVGEMIAASEGSAQRFAIHVPDAIDLPEAELAIAPYTFGAWLGDGYSGQAAIISDGRGIIDEIVAEGYDPVRKTHNDQHNETTFTHHFGDAMKAGLSSLGLKTTVRAGNRNVPTKHIPQIYLRASIEQRLSLLQGLMDTDGTIDKTGCCAISLSEPGLAEDVLELVRSLGIKASASIHPAYYTKRDEQTGEMRRVQCKDSTTISFTTVQKVFQLDRKVSRLPIAVRDTQDWLYIKSIEPIPTQPGRCLTVEDPDATYLVDGFVPTSNTLLLLWLSHQFSKMKRPNIIIDPKALAVNTPIVTPDGTKTIAELEPGDEIIDSTGGVHHVTSKSKVFNEDETTIYRLHTGDGQATIADGQHRWIIVDGSDRRVMTTSEIIADYGENPFATGDICLPMPAPLVGRETDLPVAPGVLGAWMAGRDATGEVADVWPEMAVRSPESRMIPAIYHRASIPQRQAVIAAVISVLGTVESSGRVLIDMAASVRRDDLVDFIRSFGYRVFTTDEAITFVADSMLGIRADDGSNLPESVPEAERAMPVVSISEAEYEPVQCISVDSPDHSYLTGGFLITHNTGSDHSQAVLASGGQVASLDTIEQSDGVFDPIRFMMKQSTDKGEAGSVQSAADLAASVILQINPFGSVVDDYEVLLNRGLLFGVENGAQCTGQALKIVEDNLGEIAHTQRDREDYIQIISRIRQATHSPSIRSVIGMDPTTAPLGVAEGTTLLKVGDSHLDLPQPGHPAQSMQQRAAMALVRMMVYGSAMALTGRGGVLHLDEAWTFLQSSASEVERLGRLARSQEVLPILYSQRVKDAVDAGLSGYISRGLIMHIKDVSEARLACQLFNLEPTEERIGRITAEDHISNGGQLIPNFNSLKALREGGEDEAGEVIRGAVALYADLSGERAVPTEVTIPSEFFDLISTNPLDIARRNERLHQRDVSKMAV